MLISSLMNRIHIIMQVITIFEGDVVDGKPHGRGHAQLRSGVSYIVRTASV